MPDRRTFLKAGLAVAATTLGVTACSPAQPAASPTPKSFPKADIPVGSGTIFSDAKLVVTQPAAGQFKSFDYTCPHQGCPVTKMQGRQIVCACHNSYFDIADGHVISGPATSGLTPADATVEGDHVLVAG